MLKRLSEELMRCRCTRTTPHASSTRLSKAVVTAGLDNPGSSTAARIPKKDSVSNIVLAKSTIYRSVLTFDMEYCGD